MAYLGRQLNAGNYLKLDDISSGFNGSTTTFNLTSGGSAHYPGSAYSILVSLGGIIQEPESAFNINQNQIVFATAPVSTDDFFCISLGEPLNINVPGNATVDSTKLASGGISYNDTITATEFIGPVESTSVNVVGVVTATSFKGDGSQLTNLTGVSTNFVGAIGIQSAGLSIGVGVTQLNFIGAGNTFLYNATDDTIDISIAGGGGAGGKFISGGTGIGTLSTVGFGTTTPVGTGNSEGIIQAVGNIAI